MITTEASDATVNLQEEAEKLLTYGDFGIEHALADIQLESLDWCCRQRANASVADLMRMSAGRRFRDILLDTGGPLFGPMFDEKPLVAEPYFRRLDALPADLFCVGLAHAVALACWLRDGVPPTDKYTPEDRELVLRLDSVRFRVASRAWHHLREAADGLDDMNERAEGILRLLPLWPTKEPLDCYVRLIYRSYVVGHDLECVILCRSLLECAVDAALGELQVHSMPLKMSAKLDLLQKRDVLTPAFRSHAQGVWQIGSDVVHGRHRIALTALEVVKRTFLVVQRMQSLVEATES